ncbi:MAG: PKD domain-containing protein [Bacteroidota bacterium]
MKKLIPALAFMLISVMSFSQELTVNGTLLSDGEGVSGETVFLTTPSTFTFAGDTLATVTTESNGSFYIQIDESFDNEGFIAFSSPGCNAFNNEVFPFTSEDTLNVVFLCDSATAGTEAVYIGGGSLDGALDWQFQSSVFGDVVSYAWDVDDMGATYNTADITHTFSTAGVYNVSLECVFASGNTLSDELTIYVSSENTIDTDTLCSANWYPLDSTNVTASGNVVYFVNASTGSDLSYEWTFGDGNLSTEEFPEYVFGSDQDEYNVCLFVYNEYCIDTLCLTVSNDGLINGLILQEDGKDIVGQAKSDGFTFKVLPLNAGLLSTNTEIAEQKLGLFPNPTAGELNLSLELDQAEQGRIVIVDQTGRQVYQESVNMIQGTNTFRTDVDLPSGLYIVRYSGLNNEAMSKFVIR